MALASLQGYSDELAHIVDKVSRSTVRVGNGDRSAGTGIVWSADGVILTANHVVERAPSLHVRTADKVYDAELVGKDAGTDLALVKIPATGLTPAEFGDSKSLQVGHIVFALGHPWGDRLTVTSGIVSAIGKLPMGRTNEQFAEGLIQTDSRLYPGFSGGPLADASGRVVGLNSSVVGGDLGVAIPSETIQRVAAQLIQSGRAKQGYLGVAVQKVPLHSAWNRLGLKQETGLLVMMVENASPADRAGLLPGDIIVGTNGTPLGRLRDLHHWLGTPLADQSVPLKVIRGGQLREIPVMVEMR